MKKRQYKIFDLEYLQNAEFTEDDLRELLDKKSFSISLAVGMLKMCGCKMPTSDIVSQVTSDKHWMYKHFWTKEQRENFTQCLRKSYYNLYRYNNTKLNVVIDFWLIQYGLTNCKQKKKEE